MKPFRLNRLFDPDSGKALDVAIDHGFFGERGFLDGIEDISASVRTLVDAGPDAIQMTLGQAHHLQSVPGKQKPGLVMRTDVANVYNAPLDEQLYSHHVPFAVEEAVRLDAVALCVNLMQLPGHPEIRGENIRSIFALREQASRLGMPLMIEPLVMQDNSVAGGYQVDGDIDKIMTLVRQATELGADLIKADPCDDPREYHRVIRVAGSVPVLVRGGGRVDDKTLLERTAAVLDAGAAGIVYGRNVVQHRNPYGITAALMGVLHKGIGVDEALKLVDEVRP